ncbi:MAG: hypothetical protein ABIQ18_10450 [Umezawaea sp.]
MLLLAATTGTLVGYESWLERDRLVLLDFDPDDVGIASQPFWLFFGEQVQIDSTPIDVRVLAADGALVRADLTIAVDIAIRTICAAVLRPVGTKDIDAALLRAKMPVPEPMRPGWSDALPVSASRLPRQRLFNVDARMREATARPVNAERALRRAGHDRGLPADHRADHPSRHRRPVRSLPGLATSTLH